ncbi:MAG: hypothetical protein QOJ65_2564 [Fimbriimonadaceae bacterium]|jgi:four helix bundle protein|nr:hypothetical protein [Fimbriimonadaceae bacterium]
MAHQPIEELEVFRYFENVADWAWKEVETWSHLAQNTIGTQLIRAADSINANLVEGDGRYSIADAIRFFVIGRASARETRLWIRRAVKRKLVPEVEAALVLADLESGAKFLNQLIAYRRSAKFVKETRASYAANPLEDFAEDPAPIP